MTNLNKQTVFTPEAKKTVKASRQEHPETPIEIYPFTHLDKRYQNAHPFFLIFKIFFICLPHLFEPGKAFCTPSREKKFQKIKKSSQSIMN